MQTFKALQEKSVLPSGVSLVLCPSLLYFDQIGVNVRQSLNESPDRPPANLSQIGKSALQPQEFRVLL